MDSDEGRTQPATEAFQGYEGAIAKKRAELVAELQRMRYGQDVTLEFRSGQELRGRLHGCNGVSVSLLDGRTFPVTAVRAVLMHVVSEGPE